MDIKPVEVLKEEASMGLDPMLNKSAREIFSDLGKRSLLLFSKLLSVKVLVLVLFVWLYLQPESQVTPWHLLTISGIVIFGREFLKFMKDMR